MGFSMKEGEDIYSLEKIIEEFDTKRLGSSGAFFDIQKLDWINQQYIIEHISEDELWARMKKWMFNDEFMQSLMPLCHTRIKTFGGFMELCSFLFVQDVEHKLEDLTPKGITHELSCMVIQVLIWLLEKEDVWTKEAIESAIKRLAEAFGLNLKKIVIALLYAAITGKKSGPPLFASCEILGKERMRARLLKVMEFLGGLGKKRLEHLQKALDEDTLNQFHHKSAQ